MSRLARLFASLALAVALFAGAAASTSNSAYAGKQPPFHKASCQANGPGDDCNSNNGVVNVFLGNVIVIAPVDIDVEIEITKVLNNVTVLDVSHIKADLLKKGITVVIITISPCPCK